MCLLILNFYSHANFREFFLRLFFFLGVPLAAAFILFHIRYFPSDFTNSGILLPIFGYITSNYLGVPLAAAFILFYTGYFPSDFKIYSYHLPFSLIFYHLTFYSFSIFYPLLLMLLLPFPFIYKYHWPQLSYFFI